MLRHRTSSHASMQRTREALKFRQVTLHDWAGPSHFYFGNVERHIGWKASLPAGSLTFPHSSFELENTVETKDFCTILVSLSLHTPSPYEECQRVSC